MEHMNARMNTTTTQTFRHKRFSERLGSMLRVDMRRMFRTKLLYILLGTCLVMPILITVMTGMMDGTVSKNPQTGEETVIEGFDNAWQLIGSVSSDGTTDDSTGASTGASAGGAAAMGAGMDMDITSMCNMNMLYFAVAVLVCLFIAEDFRSGYAKNLFTVRAEKGDYVASKTLVCSLGAVLMLSCFVVGVLIGGLVSGLPFTMEGFGVGNLIFCILSKLALVTVFVPIYVVMSVIARSRSWMSLLLSLMTGMFLFMMIPMLTPLNATAMHLILCLAGGCMFGFGLGAVSKVILKKVSLV